MQSRKTTDTIAAIATAMSNSGIGIIRISGSEAIEIVSRIFKSKKEGKTLCDVPSHTVHYGIIQDENEVLDEVLVLIMKGPHSYTAEDTVEIDCHGGMMVMRKILETVLKYGARPAEPGEFTKRAFLNGRMDLSQAEAVIDVIQAKNEYAVKSSVSQLKGSVSRKVRDLRDKILYQVAYIESALDDPEHISLVGYSQELWKTLEPIKKDVDKMISSADHGRVISEGVKTVILGKPNAGKSSLLNVLLGADRAIVTEIAGTTRDTLEEQIQLQGIHLNIIDTAGIRDTEDVVEKIGVARAKLVADEADLIIFVVDGSTRLDENDKIIIDLIMDRKAIVILNKSDLAMLISKEELAERTNHQVITISAKEETGIEELEQAIREMFYAGEIDFNDEIMITNVRHKTALIDAKESLALVQEGISSGMPEDFLTIDLMNAFEALGSIIGEAVGDDLINEIFSKFCMGK